MAINLEDYLNNEDTAFGNAPVILDFQNNEDARLAQKLFEEKKIQKVTDHYISQEREYFSIQNPSIIFDPPLFEQKFKEYISTLESKNPLSRHGRWIYFPWLFALVHILEEERFYVVRTARNKHLIGEAEQNKFYNSAIGIAGLSIGHSVALTLVLEGGAKKLKIADFDQLDLSNLNRIRTGINNLGDSKINITARSIYEINPYAVLEIYPKGLTEENVDEFLQGLDLMIDEMDSFPVKILLRERAKNIGLPVLMALDNAEEGIVDIERYDQDKNTELFNGRIGELKYEDALKLTKLDVGKLLTKYVGFENVSNSMKKSLLEIGKTVVSWPQLGEAATLNGAAVAHLARKILSGKQVITNRAIISLADAISPADASSHKVQGEDLETLKKQFGI